LTSVATAAASAREASGCRGGRDALAGGGRGGFLGCEVGGSFEWSRSGGEAFGDGEGDGILSLASRVVVLIRIGVGVGIGGRGGRLKRIMTSCDSDHVAVMFD